MDSSTQSLKDCLVEQAFVESRFVNDMSRWFVVMERLLYF